MNECQKYTLDRGAEPIRFRKCASMPVFSGEATGAKGGSEFPITDARQWRGRTLAHFNIIRPRKGIHMNLLQKWSPLGTSRWDPFKEMEAMQDRLNRAFGVASLPGNAGKELMSVSEWAPLVDITEDDNEYLIKAELPEVKKDDVKVNVENGVLSITGERRYEHEEKTKKQHRIERSYGRFERSFTLPDEADGTRVCAEFKDGLLKVHLPKNTGAKPKSIDIKVS